MLISSARVLCSGSHSHVSILLQVMHSSTSPNLHTPKCNELIDLLMKCHKENPVKRFIGHCNSENYRMLECLKEEREANRLDNAAKAKVKREEVQQRMRNSSDTN